MSLVAEYDAASPTLALGPTLESFPALEVELERQYALDPDRPVAFCWMGGVDADRLEAGLAADETITEVERYETAADRILYRVRESERNAVSAYREWVRLGAELLDARGTNGHWEIRMRFPDRNAFATYHDFLEANGIAFDLYRLSDGDRTGHDDVVTPRQRDALRAAYEMGFFDVPRETTLGELATELGISDQAVSERLRRGQSRLLEQHDF
ncbi:helix-turn-helix domain-containing protein [Halomontanus rarus]|uniref:helix-turn-helix domain-containing protein n=1 Tax=Halomontanus rarus TaxID=3034020 RepID=UPI001A99F3FB